MITGMKKCAFYDPATGTVVQLNLISEEGEIKIREPLSVKDADGQNRFAGHHSAVEITAYDSTGYAQLKSWMDNDTELNFVSYGIEGHILWYKSAPITVTKNIQVKPGMANSFTVRIEAKGGDQTSTIKFGKNLMYMFAGFADGDSDEEADNYTFSVASGSMTYDFSTSNVQKVTCATDGELEVSVVNLIYPIAGAVLDAFLNLGGNNTETADISVLQKSFAGTTLQTSTESNDAVLNFTTPASTYKLNFLLISGQVMTAGDIFEFSYPFIGVQATQAEIAY